MATKICTKCGRKLDTNNFYDSNTICNKCYNEICLAYVRTFGGRVRFMYKKMRERTRKSYYNLPGNLPSQQDFIDFASSSKKLKNLFRTWKRHNYLRAYAPTVDRINSNIGYEMSNLQFLSMRDNSAKSDRSGKLIKANTRYVGVYKKGKKFLARVNFQRKQIRVGYFSSAKTASVAVDLKCLELGIPLKNSILKKK